MPVSDPEVIDLVVHDPKADIAVLVMVEERSWGPSGALLPALQAKLGTYLGYALDGPMVDDYPALEGKPIAFQLSSLEPPGPREREFLGLVQSKYLDPNGIGWRESLIPAV